MSLNSEALALGRLLVKDRRLLVNFNSEGTFARARLLVASNSEALVLGRLLVRGQMMLVASP